MGLWRGPEKRTVASFFSAAVLEDNALLWSVPGRQEVGRTAAYIGRPGELAAAVDVAPCPLPGYLIPVALLVPISWCPPLCAHGARTDPGSPGRVP